MKKGDSLIDSMIIIEALMAMMFVVPVVAFMALMMWLLHRMNRPGRVWAGWTALAVVFILITGVCFMTAKYGVTTGFGLQTYQLWPEGKNAPEGSIDVVYDWNAKKVYGFSSLRIQYKDGNRYIPLVFDQDGNLTGSKEAMAYKKEIRDALKDGGPNVTLTGKSQSHTTIRQLEQKYLNQKSTTFHKDVFSHNLLIFNMVTIVLLGYFLMDIWRRKRKEKHNTTMIKIQDL